MIRTIRFGSVILALLLVCSTVAFAATIVFHVAVNVTTSSTQILDNNSDGTLLIVQNDSDTTIYCKWGAAAVVNQGIRLGANGGTLLLDNTRALGALNCIHGGTGNKVLLISQGPAT